MIVEILGTLAVLIIVSTILYYLKLNSLYQKNFYQTPSGQTKVIPHFNPLKTQIKGLYDIVTNKIRGRDAFRRALEQLLVHSEIKESKLCQSSFFGMHMILTWNAEVARAILFCKDSELGKPEAFLKLQERLVGDSIFLAVGEKWKAHKTALSPAFKWDHIRSILPKFLSVVDELVSTLKSQVGSNPVELYPWMQKATLEAIASAGFGFEFGALREGSDRTAQIENYESLMKEFQNPIHLFERLDRLTGGYSKLEKLFSNFESFIAALISSKREMISKQSQNESWVPNDVLDYLLWANDHNGLTDQQIARNMNTFFIAGHETTAVSLANLLYFLSENPDIQKRARAEVLSLSGSNPPSYDELKQMDLIDRCIKETLRLRPPAPIVLRKADHDQQVHNLYVNKGALVGVHIYAIHKDPNYWEDPERFDPDRFLPEQSKNRPPYAWMPFSIGPRQCIGNNFALLEMRCFLARILQAFDIVPDPNSKETFCEYVGTGLQPPPKCTLLLKPL